MLPLLATSRREGNGDCLSRIAAVLQIPTPKTKTQVLEYLDATEYVSLWIAEFVDIRMPLYTSTKQGNYTLNFE